ncbi:tail fiber protein [uncultured Aquimarina sp.]|uniref:tail fiber protein n=1 Tax=uncultured Aquimarina sp. TaxID=575652 RepID=UPI00263804F1|nr:tail fiber protein [uncultured Aquimarina sp.]
MKKNIFIILLLVVLIDTNAQTTTFDNLNANPLTGKAINWISSNYGSGFGHRIINSDPGGQTLLNFQGRHNSDSWADIMSLTSSGNVGIGTTNPNVQLVVGNNFGATISGSGGGHAVFGTNLAVQNGGGNHNKLYTPYSHTNNYGYAGIHTSWGKINFYTQKSNTTSNQIVTPVSRMIINENGNIGIGTTSPNAKLQVEGQTKVGKWGVLTLDWTNETNWGGSSNKWAGYVGFNSSRNDEDPKDHYRGTNKYTSKGVFEGSNYGFRWLFRNHNNYDSQAQHLLTEYMRLTNNGNLGIGTTTPDAKLTVKGNIHTQEVKVDLNGAVAPDYVFLEDYDLKTINEVEAYIKDQGHLPNIPSAAEMEQNGIELKQMNLNLLEKIEELTLYTIAQEKQLKEANNKLLISDTRLQTLEDKNKELETRLEKLEKILTK